MTMFTKDGSRTVKFKKYIETEEQNVYERISRNGFKQPRIIWHADHAEISAYYTNVMTQSTKWVKDYFFYKRSNVILEGKIHILMSVNLMPVKMHQSLLVT